MVRTIIKRKGSEGMDLSKIDLCKIGKCELCVLAKQVRARKIEIGEKAKDTGTWDQELMDEYERCASNVENLRDCLHRFESRKYRPSRTVADLFVDIYDYHEKDKADAFIEAHSEIIREGMRLIGVSFDSAGSDSDHR